MDDDIYDDAGMTASWSINTHVRSSNTNPEPLYFGEGEAIFRLNRNTKNESYNNIPSGVFRALADANAWLKEHHTTSADKFKLVQYYKLCDDIAYLGVLTADSPKANKTNELTVTSSRYYDHAVNYWGKIQPNDRLWFVLEIARVGGYVYPVIVPLITQMPSRLSNLDEKDNRDSLAKIHQTIDVELKEEAPATLFVRHRMYAGHVLRTSTLVKGFDSIVPPGLLFGRERRAELGGAHRFTMFVNGRCDFV